MLEQVFIILVSTKYLINFTIENINIKDNP